MLIESAFIYSEIFPWMCLKVVCGTYSNWTYGFASPLGLWKVVERVPVECNCLFKSIGFFAWYKTSFKFLAQAYFCWLSTCVYWIYLISIHWSWNLSSIVIENLLWALSKLEMRILFHLNFVEGRGKGVGICSYYCHHQCNACIQGNNIKVLMIFCWFRTVVRIRVGWRGTGSHRSIPLHFSVTISWLQLQNNMLISKNNHNAGNVFKRCIVIKVCMTGKILESRRKSFRREGF